MDQALREANHGHGAVLAGYLKNGVQLLGRGLDDTRMAVPRVVHEVARGEVEVLLAVNVGDDAILGVRDDYRLAFGMRPRAHHVLGIRRVERVSFFWSERVGHSVFGPSKRWRQEGAKESPGEDGGRTYPIR